MPWLLWTEASKGLNRSYLRSRPLQQEPSCQTDSSCACTITITYMYVSLWQLANADDVHGGDIAQRGSMACLLQMSYTSMFLLHICGCYIVFLHRDKPQFKHVLFCVLLENSLGDSMFPRVFLLHATYLVYPVEVILIAGCANIRCY